MPQLIRHARAALDTMNELLRMIDETAVKAKDCAKRNPDLARSYADDIIDLVDQLREYHREQLRPLLERQAESSQLERRVRDLETKVQHIEQTTLRSVSRDRTGTG